MAKLKATLKKTLDILTSSTHKEINIGARRQHDNIVQGLVRQLDKYFDPFLIGSARHMKTGVEIDHNIVIGLLSSMEAGEKYQIISSPETQSHNGSTFLTRLPEGPKGCERSQGRSTSFWFVHSYPLTTVPLALATPERDLRQGSKAALRNYLIEKANSITPTEILLVTNQFKATADRKHITHNQAANPTSPRGFEQKSPHHKY